MHEIIIQVQNAAKCTLTCSCGATFTSKTEPLAVKRFDKHAAK